MNNDEYSVNGTQYKIIVTINLQYISTSLHYLLNYITNTKILVNYSM